jgi:tRNA U34 5-carboxymethylaminomethyl modifying enzyme MnmG/GidA
LSDFVYPKIYDVIVIGAGHAGIEAAMASARLGCETLLLTQNADTVGQMSCNPAIGGLAKGHMVREIDALGGAMGLNTDATGIQFRMLNATKGPSVRAPRAQCDKKAYQFRMKALLERHPRLDMKQGNVTRLVVGENGVEGVETNFGLRFNGGAVVVTTGTFMRGLLHVGLRNQTGGRLGDAVSTFSDCLRELGFEVERFKTGTPCRLLAKSIDFSQCEPQQGDEPPPLFSYLADTLVRGEDDRVLEEPAVARTEAEQQQNLIDLGANFDANLFEQQGNGWVLRGNNVGLQLQGRLIINGRVDRLVVTPERVLVIDFKTDQPAPDDVSGVAESYIVQMAAYCAVLERAYPGREIGAVLCWTDGPRMMRIPDAMLSEALNSVLRVV